MAEATQRAGDWIQTYTGLSMWPLEPAHDQICIEDIAHSLALQCRFNGHCNVFYCVTPDTRLLTDDFRWVDAGNIKLGDGLLAFDEMPAGKGEGKRPRRKLRHATVLHDGPIVRNVYRIVLSDGSELKSSAEHPWLCSTKVSRNQVWRTTAELASDLQRGCARYLPRFLKPRTAEMSQDSAWLSAAFDCEGHVCGRGEGKRGFSIGFAQNPNCVLQKAENILRSYGIAYSKTPNPQSDVYNLVLLGEWFNRVDFLSRFDCCRLLSKVTHLLRCGDLSVDLVSQDLLRIERIENLGMKEVSAIETSTRTYIAEGFGAHNSVAEHCVRAAEWIDDMFTDSMLSVLTLLHDASEAYLCDIPRPIKPYLTNYMEIEAQMQERIHDKFGLTEWLRENDNGINALETVKYIDTKMLATESRDLMGHNAYTRWGHKLGQPVDDKIIPWPAEVAEAKFLTAFHEYKNRE